MARPRAIGYVRVSTQEQVSGFGLEVQEGAVRDWAKASGVRLLGIARDEGQSGSNALDTRAGLAGVLARLERGEAEILVVYRLDRLARDLVLQETTITRLQERGCRVASVTEPDVEGDDPTRVLVRQVLGALAQYERAVIRARMMAGRQVKRAAGGYSGGRPPYGSRAAGGELESDERERAAVQLMLRLRRLGTSYRVIAQRLNEEGFETKAGRPWQPMVVKRIVDRAA